jgi:hypothetical protein
LASGSVLRERFGLSVMAWLSGMAAHKLPDLMRLINALRRISGEAAAMPWQQGTADWRQKYRIAALLPCLLLPQGF